ncbi:MAG: S8 family serine peptidase, partial [Woeseiaceae bacterium]
MLATRIMAACVALLVPFATIADAPILFLADTEDPSARKVYIVQLHTPSVAEMGSMTLHTVQDSEGVDKARPRLDKSSAAARNHLAKILNEQDAVLARAGDNVDKIYGYAYGLNGFAALMSASQAHKLRHLPEVRAVWEDEIRPMTTRHSPTFLGLFDNDSGLRANLDGTGLVIGFIDSGVHPEHEALSDTREADRPRACHSTWAESTLLGRWLCGRFRRMDDVVLFEPPENWNGTCQAGERFEETDCNNKLIGARWFIDGALATGPIDVDEIRSARDVDGHGTHTATTAAGNRSTASVYGTKIGTVQGMAPGARVAIYKACWLRPGAQRAACNTSDLAMAIDAAVADGVDIINYSVGSSEIEVSAPDDAALMAAAKAGVVSVVAAGNTGPNLGTIGSPAGGPWVITAAASTRDGEFSREAMQILSPSSIAARYAVKEANFTPRLKDNDSIEAELVLADDDTGTASDACEALVNDTEVDGNIALIQRGSCDFDIKIQNAGNAGAVAALVYNIAGDPIVMNGDSDVVDIPALMVGQADGNLFIAEIDNGNIVTAVLESSFLLTEPETGNVMATFSSRGPGPVQDIMKPDVSAPGVNIIAGFTPETANATKDELWAYLSGTSMSTPHVAGVAALLMQEHPDWSPAAIKSALMTTSRQDLTNSTGGQANPFEFGTGHIVPNDAVDPGLVFELGDDDYDAFACGQRLDTVTQQRCADLETAGMSLEATDMNQPNIAMSRFVSSQTVRRSVTSVSDQTETYAPTIFRPIDM